MILATDQQSDGRGLSPVALQFIALRDAVMDRWEREVRARVDGAGDLLRPVLTNTLPAFLDNIAEALSPDHPRRHGASGTTSPSAHGDERARMTPFGPDQVIHEYQILREAIAAETKGRIALEETHWAIIDKSINAATREAIRTFTRIHEDLRRKVAAALSHDMRTPLAVIDYGAQVISLAPDLDVARRTASRIEENSARLRAMMSDLLDALTFQGAAKMPLRLTRFDVRDLVGDVCEQYRQGADRHVRFEADSDSVTGFWCRDSLRRSVENLVNNAVKYGNGGTIRIVARETRGRLMLSVHNDGNPIPADRQERIFDYLHREAGVPAVDGWGVGLPFVKAVADSHGGSVSVDSAPQTGTTFLIDVPVDCRPFVEQPARAAAADYSA
ncbi:HAMP domain-containing sensor histidine kinase [Massilia sp. YIM B02763]|uniref:sensor histidine kinase n=1 Tax=Massilia sp. YIM B02763 TaxID=3050130 RepID=UPI0025B64FBC|nr:HAMP domain-containing sensor histidine kinase [Massilia sp. YIM B02763]MDN4055008.1 HAMP domain-containing sensor histidine kinase [Massilia sp. YIM B02763]